MLAKIARPSSTAATIEAKLSSVEHHVGRLLGDVGAGDAHRHADVGAPSAPARRSRRRRSSRRSRRGLERLDDAQLVLRGDAREDGDVAHGRARSAASSSARARRRSRAPPSAGDPELARRSPRRCAGWSPVIMIDPDARALRLARPRRAPPARGGSIMPTTPRNTRSCSSSSPARRRGRRARGCGRRRRWSAAPPPPAASTVREDLLAAARGERPGRRRRPAPPCSARAGRPARPS